MISKLRFSLMIVIMLVLLGFGFQNQAKGQVGLDGLFCPAVPYTTGFLETELLGTPPGFVAPNFSGGLIGTVEAIPGLVFGGLGGGLDWQHVDHTEFPFTTTPTNEVGSQLISWWTQVDGRNTYYQVTNSAGANVTVHVRIFNADCIEIRDFCDTYTPNDTHEYNFGNLVTNLGQSITIPAGNEGFVVTTAVKDCDTDNEKALDWNWLTGQLIVHDSNNYLYGVNTYTRFAICTEGPDIVTQTNLIRNGSFQTGNLNFWNRRQGAVATSDAVTALAFSPPVPVPPNPDPNTDNPPSPPGDPNTFEAVVVSSGMFPSGFYNGGKFINLPIDLVFGTGPSINVSVIETNNFNVSNAAPPDDPTVRYDISNLTGENIIFPLFNNPCLNWSAVLLIQDLGGGIGDIVDATCYVETAGFFGGGGGAIRSNVAPFIGKPCVQLTDSNFDIAYNAFLFDGRSGFQINESLTRQGGTGNFVVQVVTGQQNAIQCSTFGQFGVPQDNGGVVDNFRIIHTEITNEDCRDDGCLTGESFAKLDDIHPETLTGQFNLLPGNVLAGADVVLINFADSYGPPYRVLGAFESIDVTISNDLEETVSCGQDLVCFTRLGVDDSLILSQNFTPPTGTPTAPPTIGPTIVPPPTLVPTPTGGGGGGKSSCAIAGNPVQLGTALANVLIPLVPVAFAFGVRAVRRRKK